MATAIFHGGGADATNFSASDNWSGGSGASGVPGANDDVRITSNVADVTTNCSAFSAVNLTSLTVTPDCRVKLGATSTPITFGTITTLTDGGGGEYRKFSGTVTTAHLDPTGGTTIISGGTWTTVNASQGNILLAAAATVTNAYIIGAVWTDEGGSAYTLIDLSAGSCTTARSCGTVHVGAYTTYTTTAAAAVSTVITVNGLGTFNHKSSGTITLMTVKSRGRFTPAGSPYNFTVTNATIYRGATAVDQAPGITLTKTNAWAYKGVYESSAGGDW